MARNRVKEQPVPPAGDVPAVAATYSRFGAGESGERRKDELWGAVDAQLLREFIELVTARGDGLAIARTSDGGAMSLTILHDKQRLRLYSHSTADMEADLEATIRELKA